MEKLYEDLFSLILQKQAEFECREQFEILSRGPREYNLFKRKTEVQKWAVPFEKVSHWIAQCMLCAISAHWPSDYLHNKSRFGQTNPSSCCQYTLLAASFWLHPKLPLPWTSCFLFFLWKVFLMPQCVLTAPGIHYWKTCHRDNETVQGWMALSLSSSESAVNMGKVL